MELPFTSDQFFGVFRAYNKTVWPAQLILMALAVFSLVVFALIIYLAWSTFDGHGYPAIPTFGLPCPTTLFTIGLLTFLVLPYPRSTIVVPVLWSLVGAQTAVLLGVRQDIGLLAATAIGAFMFAWASMSAGATKG